MGLAHSLLSLPAGGRNDAHRYVIDACSLAGLAQEVVLQQVDHLVRASAEYGFESKECRG